MTEFSRLGLDKLFDTTLGQRDVSGNTHQYSSIFSDVFWGYFCGADCLEDLNAINDSLNSRLNTNIPSADTVGRSLKELAAKDNTYECKKSSKNYRFNTEESMKPLLLLMTKRLGLIKLGSHIDIDFGHQFVPCKKRDAKYSYKQNLAISLDELL